MTQLDDSIAAAREVSFWDGEDRLGGVWLDPLERVAMGLYHLSFNGPETTHGDFTRAAGREEIEKTWRALPRPDRHLYRRRAAVVFDLAQRMPKGA